MPTNLARAEVEELIAKLPAIIPIEVKDAIKKVINENNGDINAKDIQGYSLMHRVIQYDHSGAGLALLLSIPGIDINQIRDNGSTLLHFAVFFKNFNAVKMLVESGSIYKANRAGKTPLHYAIKWEKGDLISKYLLSLNLDGERNLFDNRNLFHVAALANNINLLEELMKSPILHKQLVVTDIYGNTPLDYAIFHGSVDAIKILQPDITDEDLKKLLALPYFGKSIFLQSVDQYTLNKHMIEYINHEAEAHSNLQWKGSDVVDEEGQCNAWAFIFGLFVSMQKEDKLIAIKQAIATAKISEEDNNLRVANLPPSIQRKYPYHSQQELLDQYRNPKMQSWFSELRNKQHEEVVKFFAEFNEFLAKKELAKKDEKQRKEKREVLGKLMGEMGRRQDIINGSVPLPDKKTLEGINQELEELKRKFFSIREEMLFGDGEASKALYAKLQEKYKLFKNKSEAEKADDPFKEICEDLFEKYNNRKDIFEEIIPVTAIFQKTSKVTEEIAPGVTQIMRVEQSQLAISQPITALGALHRISFKQNSSTEHVINQLAKILSFYGQFPGIYVDLGGGKHAVGLSIITKNGKIAYKYNDSNWELERNLLGENNTFQSAQELAAHIVHFKYETLGEKLHESIFLDFQPWKFEKSDLTYHPDVTRQDNPQFVVIQHEILNNAQSKQEVLDLVRSHPEKFIQKNIFGIIPLSTLFALKDIDTVKASIDNLKLNFNTRIEGKTPLMIALEGRADDRIIQYILEKPSLDINSMDLAHRNALMYAIEMQASHGIIKMILDHARKREEEQGIALNLELSGYSVLFKQYKTVFEFAKGKEDIVKMLRDFEQTQASRLSKYRKKSATAPKISPSALVFSRFPGVESVSEGIKHERKQKVADSIETCQSLKSDLKMIKSEMSRISEENVRRNVNEIIDEILETLEKDSSLSNEALASDIIPKMKVLKKYQLPPEIEKILDALMNLESVKMIHLKP